MGVFVLTVDVEPDSRSPPPGSNPSWNGVGFFLERLARWRELIQRDTGIAPSVTWFVRIDPQIAEACGRAAWESVFPMLPPDDAVGLHVHPSRWLPDRGEWLNDFGNPQWIAHCLDLGFREFERARGVACRLFRFGDRYLDEAILDELERRGVEIDMTVEAGAMRVRGHVPSEASTGFLPDTRHAPRRPYHPARRNFRREARWRSPRALWEVPVTTGTINDRDVVHLNLGLHPEWIARVAWQALRAGDPVIVSVARTGDAISGEARANFDTNLTAISTLAGHRAFVTPFRAVKQWR